MPTPSATSSAAAGDTSISGAGDGASAGVLLYYKYTPIPDLDALSHFYSTTLTSLSLLGRVRLAPDGVNVTISGALPSLHTHIAALSSNPLFADTDFKLAASPPPSSSPIAGECGFTSLSIRIVKELVTFGSVETPRVEDAGRHLTAVEWNEAIKEAGEEVVMVDARNVYETRIGGFRKEGVETVDPGIRQYSDLPGWIDENAERLRNKKVLMYCTGGIRCEMASAYIRSKGEGYENVFQLYGGIQRYLEQFPDGGYFKGKNFVFDHRISVGSLDRDVVGACLACKSSFDDYSPRRRCSYCRMLVLVCNSCQEKFTTDYICEICQKHGKGGRSRPAIQDSGVLNTFSPKVSEEMETNSFSEISGKDVNSRLPRKLRILCLHGFRQNASAFKGRCGSLSKKLKNIVEFVFVDAPHEVPFIYQPRTTERDPHLSVERASNSDSFFERSPSPGDNCRKRFAWLVASKSSSVVEPGWVTADEPFDPLQYKQQTDGFQESYAYLKSVLQQTGPFDGILGFSQGAAVTAFFCDEQQRSGNTLGVRFAILCSGFVAGSKKFDKELINCPSLHIYGNWHGQDRQIDCQASRELADLFDKGSSMVVEHDMGHIIPTRPPYLDQMKAFLLRFL